MLMSTGKYRPVFYGESPPISRRYGELYTGSVYAKVCHRTWPGIPQSVPALHRSIDSVNQVRNLLRFSLSQYSPLFVRPLVAFLSFTNESSKVIFPTRDSWTLWEQEVGSSVLPTPTIHSFLFPTITPNRNLPWAIC